MTYCHVSNQIAQHANQPEVNGFADLSEWEQETIVSTLSDAVLLDEVSLKWADYPHTINLEFALQSLLEETEFLEELASAVLNTNAPKTLLVNQRQAETKGLIKHALDTTNNPPEGYSFGELLMGKAA